jgi:hypothetical protein
MPISGQVINRFIRNTEIENHFFFKKKIVKKLPFMYHLLSIILHSTFDEHKRNTNSITEIHNLIVVPNKFLFYNFKTINF